MQIGVIIEQEIHHGGGFMQSLSVLKLLNNYKSEDFYFSFYTTNKNNITTLQNQGISVEFIQCGIIEKLHSVIFKWPFLLKTLSKHSTLLTVNPFEKKLISKGLDILFFTSPTWHVLLVNKLNYILTIWDQCHRDFPEFPEIRKPGEFESREYFLNNTLKKAVAIIVDSEISKENMSRRYGIDNHRIHPLPFVAISNIIKPEGEAIDINRKYSIDGDYILYPAQFWAHKNHRYILEALSLLKKNYNTVINAVFTGNDNLNLDFIKTMVKQLSLDNQVMFTGHIPTEDMYYFYKNATALVMPTYFGPTNLPPIEAFHIGTPVFYSDLPGNKQQIENCGFTIDLRDPDDLSRQLAKLIHGEVNIEDILRNAKKNVQSWNEQSYLDGILTILKQFYPILKTWKA